MAMNFWEAQRRAKSRTGLFIFLFVVMTLIVAVASEVAMRRFAGESYQTDVPIVGLVYLFITFGVAGFQYLMFRTFGGSYVAESVGGERIDPNTTDPSDRQLINIVEEIAIASSLPIPPIYIIPANAINAFAAGLTPNDAAITITEGSFQKLRRDELQGVIAHEFGHIYNGDMKISMRLAAMVMGFFFVLWLGLRIMQFSSFTRRDRDRGGNPLLIASFILMIAGAFTWLMGSILKACISREREYLADACAVQFTRNPEGIANALRKIAREEDTEMPQDGISISHLYLDNRAGLGALFATHPPIEKRIAAIEDRTYIPDDWDAVNKQRQQQL
jgi:heat shock protein HtpX